MSDQKSDAQSYRRSYEGVEVPENFPTPETLAAYRRMLLDETERETEFIARHFGCRKLRVLDLGSGSGRLLVQLALEGMVESAVGVEIARSRVAFAGQWASDLGLGGVRFVCGDILDYDDFEPASFDLVTCLSDTFSYLRPIRATGGAEVLARARRALRPDGGVLLHMYQLTDERRQMLALSGNQLRVWRSLPPADRFAYYLSDLEYRPADRVLTHRKVFIRRDGAIDSGRVELIGYTTPSEAGDLLRRCGFGRPTVYGDFFDAPYQECESEMLVVLAGMPAFRDRCDRRETAAAHKHTVKDAPGAWAPARRVS